MGEFIGVPAGCFAHFFIVAAPTSMCGPWMACSGIVLRLRFRGATFSSQTGLMGLLGVVSDPNGCWAPMDSLLIYSQECSQRKLRIPHMVPTRSPWPLKFSHERHFSFFAVTRSHQ